MNLGELENESKWVLRENGTCHLGHTCGIVLPLLCSTCLEQKRWMPWIFLILICF